MYDLREIEKRRLAQTLSEMARRSRESLKLYDPLPLAEQFHACGVRERLASGSNRSGKTNVAAVEMARAFLGLDPYNKYPKTDGRYLCVGKDMRHLGRVMWQKLYKSGAWRIIRDPVTGLWRTYKPWLEWDKQNKALSKPTPPLIPHRHINSIAWKDKKLNVPALVTLKNGTEIMFASSEGKPAQGFPLHGAWFDEEVESQEWYMETAARLIDYAGLFIWSFTPQHGTDQAYSIHERAEDGDDSVKEFKFLIRDNPYIDKADIDALIRKVGKDRAWVVIEGNYAIRTRRVFPEISSKNLGPYGCPSFQIPHDWTRYMAVDPGRQICAVLFLACPPPTDENHGKHVYCYAELYIENCDAEKFAATVRHIIDPHVFETFLIDLRSARVNEMGSGRSTEDFYKEAMKRHKISCNTCGAGFQYGSDDRLGRIEAIRHWLLLQDDGKARLQIMVPECKTLVWELEHYLWTTKPDGSIDDTKPRAKDDHLLWGLGALASYNPQYVKPAKRPTYDPLWEQWEKFKRSGNEGPGKPHVVCGPRVSNR